MTETKPPCDRHKNLQMIPFSLQYRTGRMSGHVCPVPGCGRHHNDEGYFDMVEGKPIWEQNTAQRWATSVREEILHAVRAKAGM